MKIKTTDMGDIKKKLKRKSKKKIKNILLFSPMLDDHSLEVQEYQKRNLKCRRQKQVNCY